MMHDARLRLAGYQQLCCPVSRGVLFSFLGNLEMRRRNRRWAMCIKSDCTNFLTITWVRICLKPNQRSSRQRRSVPRWRIELRRQILRQRWEDCFLSCHLSDTHLRPGTTWKWTSSYRLGNGGMYICGGPSYGDKFQGGGEWGFILFLPSLWRTSESRNRLKTPRRSFLQQQNISRPLGNRL